jgi:hypothetical protein
MCPLTSGVFSTVIYKTFLCPFYFEDAINSPSCKVSNGRVIGERLTGNDLEGSDRGLIWGTITPFTYSKWGEERRKSVRMDGTLKPEGHSFEHPWSVTCFWMTVIHRVNTTIYSNVIVTHGLQYGNACSALHYQQHRSCTVKHYITLLKYLIFTTYCE